MLNRESSSVYFFNSFSFINFEFIKRCIVKSSAPVRVERPGIGDFQARHFIGLLLTRKKLRVSGIVSL